MSTQRRLIEPNYTYHEVQGVLTNASASLLANGESSGDPYLIDSVKFTEKSGTARTVTLRNETTGSIAGNDTVDLLSGVDIAADEYLAFEGQGNQPWKVLANGDELYGFASANSAVNYEISYRKQDN